MFEDERQSPKTRCNRVIQALYRRVLFGREGSVNVSYRGEIRRRGDVVLLCKSDGTGNLGELVVDEMITASSRQPDADAAAVLADKIIRARKELPCFVAHVDLSEEWFLCYYGTEIRSKKFSKKTRTVEQRLDRLEQFMAAVCTDLKREFKP